MLVLLVVLMAVAGGAYFRIISKDNEHAIDFFSFWRSGQVLWQGSDPYQAAVAEPQPGISPLPNQDYPVDWRAVPANSAPILLLIAPLARLPWKSASAVWAVINLLLVILDGVLVVWLFKSKVWTWRGLLVVIIFASLVATREVVEYGQTTLLVFAGMLSALLMGDEHPILSGIGLGLALSKISLAFPLILFFLYKRWYRGLTIGILVQALGFIIIAVLGSSNPIDTGIAYLRIVLLHTDLPGYQLVAGLLQNTGILAIPIVTIGSIALWILLARWYYVRRSIAEPQRSTAALTLFIVVMQWNLLTFYHRRYDNAVSILFIALVLFWIHGLHPIFNLSTAQRRGISWATLLCVIVWVAPLYQVLSAAAYVALFDLCNLAALVISMWLLFRLPQHDETRYAHHP